MLVERIHHLNISFLLRSVALACLVLAVTGCAQDVPPINCGETDFKCYNDQALRGIRVVRENISYWSNVNLIGQALIVISGIFATVMIALQGDNNKYWTRPVGLVATALVTGITSALVSFHVPDNIDKLVDIVENMTNITNEFDYKTEKIIGGKNPQDIEEAYRTDQKFRESVNEVTKQYADDFNKLKVNMLRLSGTAAKLSSIPTAPTPSNPPQSPLKKAD